MSRDTVLTHRPGRKCTVEELDDALRLLDHELEHLRPDEPVQIRALGGYALLKHGVRESGRDITADVDTLTRDYDRAVREAIHTVAERLGLEHDWVNNDSVGADQDPAVIEAIYDAQWVPQDIGTRNVDMAIASIGTLTRAKIIAANDSTFSGRDQDEPDLMALLRVQGIESFQEFEHVYPDPFDEHSTARRLVERHFAAEAGNARRVAQLDREINASMVGGDPAVDFFDDIWDDDQETTDEHYSFL